MSKFKDSVIFEPHECETVEEIPVVVSDKVDKGARVVFGEWEGKPIIWRVLEAESGIATIVSSKPLFLKEFDTESETNVWADCSLRKWMNGEFFDKAFTETEKALIVGREFEAESKDENGSSYKTSDKIWLPSESEYLNKISVEDDMTNMHDADLIKTIIDYEGDDCGWFLRSPGCTHKMAGYVSSHYGINRYGCQVYDEEGIVPITTVKIGENIIKKVTADIYEKIDTDYVCGYRIYGLRGFPGLTDSKIGGESYWPKGVKKPIGKSGRPMCYFAQINLSDIKDRWENDGLPSHGMLQFFGDDYFRDAKVIYHETVDEELQDHRVHIAGFGCEYEKTGFGKGLTLEPRKLRKTLNDMYMYSCLLGYKGDRLNGHVVYDSEENSRKYTQLLLQIDDDIKDVNIIDAGFISFFINKEKMLEGDFSDVIVDMDGC